MCVNFNHYEHRHYQFDRFVGFSYKFSKGIQITIFSSEILNTYTRHVINQSSKNRFPNYFLQNPRISYNFLLTAEFHTISYNFLQNQAMNQEENQTHKQTHI